MQWKVEFDAAAVKELGKLDQSIAKRILTFLHERVAMQDDPRSIGDAIKGPKLGQFWKYRVGDFRIICNIEDKSIRILVLRIGNRREVYR